MIYSHLKCYFKACLKKKFKHSTVGRGEEGDWGKKIISSLIDCVDFTFPESFILVRFKRLFD